MLRMSLMMGATLAGLAVAAIAQERAGRNSNTLQLSECRIKLIDRVTLASDRPGIIEFVGATEGADVAADEQIAGLKDDVARARLAVAKREAENDIEVRYAVKASEVADAEYEKTLEVNRKLPNGGIPDIEVQRLRLAAQRAELQIEQAQNQFIIAGLNLDQAEAELETYRIFAPFAGVVTKVHKFKGEAVRQGDPIIDIVSTRRVRVEADVGIGDVWSIRKGDPVAVRLDIPGEELAVEQRTFEGKVIFVEVGVHPLTREVRVWAEVDNPDGVLKEGLNARMTIHTSGRPQTANRR